jgi:hypothetical protein
MNDILGLSLDLAEIDKAVVKIKKQINLECNTLPLLDEEMLEARRSHEAQA